MLFNEWLCNRRRTEDPCIGTAGIEVCNHQKRFAKEVVIMLQCRAFTAAKDVASRFRVTALCDPVEMPPDFKLMPTAALAHLEIAVPWAQIDGRVARLLGLTRARSLRD